MNVSIFPMLLVFFFCGSVMSEELSLDSLRLRLIHPGKFRSGDTVVEIRKAYYIGVTEVTNRQFLEFVRDTGYNTDSERNRYGGYGYSDEHEYLRSPKFSWRENGLKFEKKYPVTNVSWNDASAYCKWMSRKFGKSFRLPTEAEWEHGHRIKSTSYRTRALA